jgi:hypothetical protein
VYVMYRRSQVMGIVAFLQDWLEHLTSRLFGTLDSHVDPVVAMFEAIGDNFNSGDSVQHLEAAWREMGKSTVESVIRDGGWTYPLAREDNESDAVDDSKLRNLFAKELLEPDNSRVWYVCVEPANRQHGALGVVLGLPEEAAFGDHSFSRRFVPDDNGNFSQVPVSLMDATAISLIHEFNRATESADPIKWVTELPRQNLEIARLIDDAAARLLARPVALRGIDGASMFGMDLLSACNRVASAPYENRRCVGTMTLGVVSPLPMAITFADATGGPLRLELADVRMLRKLLEITSDDLWLVSDGAVALGYFDRKQGGEDALADIPMVRFERNSTWRFGTRTVDVMTVDKGCPRLPRRETDQDQFSKDFESVFGKSPCPAMWALVDAAKIQKHGTMIVISEGASDEAARALGSEPAGHAILSRWLGWPVDQY